MLFGLVVKCPFNSVRAQNALNTLIIEFIITFLKVRCADIKHQASCDSCFGLRVQSVELSDRRCSTSQKDQSSVPKLS